MRKDASRALKSPAIRTIAVILLASAASGCSSDVSRFTGYLSSSDNITTASIGRDNGLRSANPPAPPQDLAAAGLRQNTVQPNTPRNVALSQPMPSASGSTGNIYDSIKTGTVVQSQPLPSPSTKSVPAQPMPTMASQVMPKERPLAQTANAVELADPIKTGSTPRQVQTSTGKNDVALNKPAQVPVPSKAPEGNAAIVPKKPEVLSANNTETKPAPTGGAYTVVAGDSLGRIASRNGTTVAALRKANGLTNDNIRIGQELRLPGGSSAPAAAPAKVVTASADKKVDEIKTSTTPKTYTPPVKKVSVEEAEKETKVAVAAPQTTGIGKYRWPARGAIIAGYGANVDGERNDGIDISLPEGSAVKAAENGVVIYSGDGLKKLGNTVLVRHSDGKVTVYAHLKELNVQRGDKVTRGQQVATSGMTGSASRPKLHFEVRKDSAPVNPITFLE